MNRSLLLACAVAALASACNGPPAPPALPPAPPPVFIPPLAHTEPGEELLMRVRGGTREWRWRVGSGTATTVEIESQAYVNGEPSEKPRAAVWSRNLNGVDPDPDLALVVESISRDHIDVAGQGWDCWCIFAKGPTQARWYWVTDKLPVHGLLRLAVDTSGKNIPNVDNAIDYVPPPR